MNNLTIISAIVFSIIWHEACHALALLSVGVKVRVIQIGIPVVYRRGIFALGLFPFYGGVVAEDLAAVSKPAQVLYFASGPAGNILLGIGSIFLGIFLNTYILKMLGLISLSIGIFNLFPVPPLDGYRLLTISFRVPHRIQVIWALLGWMAIIFYAFSNIHR
ncbi:MAG: site-2 protease family protein [Anaerolineaceae bacterium]